jgi:hypothetical protein
MQAFFRVSVVLSSVAFVACGVDSPHRSLGAKSTTQSPQSVVTEVESVAPKLMIARVAVDEADSENADVQFVTLDDSITIKNGSEAARAFEAGRPLSVDASGGMALGTGTPAQVDIGAPVQAPVQMGAPCEKGCGGQVVGGGMFGVIKAKTGGMFSGVRGLLHRLRPRVLFRGQGVGYDYANEYTSSNYQYSVYQAQPGKVQNVPVQTPQPASPSQVPAPVPGKQPGYGPTPVVYYPAGNPSTQPTGGGRLD